MLFYGWRHYLSGRQYYCYGYCLNGYTLCLDSSDAIGTQLKVKIMLLSDSSNVFDDSNANFTVKGKLLLSAPNGTESWEVGTAQNIAWTRTGSIANVELRYSTDGGTTYPNVIIASTPAAVGTYAWTVADAIGSSLKAKVTDVLDATVSDISNASFTIKGKIVVGLSQWRGDFNCGHKL